MKHRLLCLGFYLGIAPLYSLFRRSRSRLTDYHHDLSLALFFVLLGIILFSIVLYVIGTFLLLNHEELYESVPLDHFSMIAQIGLLAVWLLSWLLCLVLAAAGSSWKVPVLWRLARQEWVIRISSGWTLLFFSFILFLVILGLYSSSLVSNEAIPGQIYLVYDDMGFVPRWVFAIGFMRMSQAANERWGSRSAVVAPLSRAALRRALAEGRLVFVACHGSEGLIYTPRDSSTWLDPKEVQPMEKGTDLQSVYMAGCDLGARDSEWRAALSPAEVRSFDRLSATAEHIHWLWFEGPAQVASLR